MGKLVTADIATEYLRSKRALQEACGIGPEAGKEIVAASLAQGEHNANFWFADPASGKKFVLRINYESQLGFEDQVGYEFDSLRVLESSGCTAKPYFVDRSKTLEGRGCLVMEYCEGEWLNFDKPNQLVLAAKMMADVHSVKVGEGSHFFRPADPLREQFEECAAYVKVYRESSLAEERVLKMLDRFMTVAESKLDTPFAAADSFHILNTEAVPSHFLIDEQTGVYHFVDWEKPILGEVAQDVAYFLSPTTTIWDTDFIFDMPQRQEFLKTYWDAVDGRFDQGLFEKRFDAYVVMNCLRGITWSANAWVEYHDPKRLLKNEKTLRKLQDSYLNQDFLEMCAERHFS